MVTRLIDKTFKNGTVVISWSNDVWSKNDADIFFLIERTRKDVCTVWGIVLWRLSITIGVINNASANKI